MITYFDVMHDFNLFVNKTPAMLVIGCTFVASALVNSMIPLRYRCCDFPQHESAFSFVYTTLQQLNSHLNVHVGRTTYMCG